MDWKWNLIPTSVIMLLFILVLILAELSPYSIVMWVLIWGFMCANWYYTGRNR